MSTKPQGNRRKQQRMSLAIPLRVQGHDPNGTPWDEMTTTEDADFGGAAFFLKHAVIVGNALHLSMPLPRTMRRYDVASQSYNVYALVRNTVRKPAGQRVGVMFLGKTPPRGYVSRPGGRFLLPTDTAPGPAARSERRRGPRYDLALRLKVTRTDPGTDRAEEQTITTNIGTAGAMVLTTLAVAKGDTLLIEDMESGVRTTAQVQNVFIGSDNIPRLNLRFVSPEAPEAIRKVLKRSGIPG